MDCVVTPLKTLMGFSVYLNVQLKFYNLPYQNYAHLFLVFHIPGYSFSTQLDTFLRPLALHYCQTKYRLFFSVSSSSHSIKGPVTGHLASTSIFYVAGFYKLPFSVSWVLPS